MEANNVTVMPPENPVPNRLVGFAPLSFDIAGTLRSPVFWLAAGFLAGLWFCNRKKGRQHEP